MCTPLGTLIIDLLFLKKVETDITKEQAKINSVTENPSATRMPDSSMEAKVIKEVPSEVKKKNGKSKFIITALVVVFVLILLAAIFVLYAVNFLLNPKVITDNVVLVTPSSTLTETVTPSEATKTGIAIDRNKSMLYSQAGVVYKLDINSLQKEVIKLPKVMEKGGAALWGQTDPVLSQDGKSLGIIQTDFKIGVYNFETGKLEAVALPTPQQGNLDLWLGGFSRDSKKLLIYLDCRENIGDAVNFIDCEQSFKDQKTGFYVYDLKTMTASRIYNAALKDHSWLLGWAQYNDNAILVTKEIYENNAIKMVELYEVNTITGNDIKLKTLQAKAANGTLSKWLYVYDIDANKNMLYGKGDGNNWDLYYTNEAAGDNPNLEYNAGLVKHIEGFASMQQPRFKFGDSTKIFYYSDSTTSGQGNSVYIVNSAGVSSLEKTNQTATSFIEYGSDYMVVGFNDNKIELVKQTNWQTLVSLPAFSDAEGNKARANVIL